MSKEKKNNVIITYFKGSDKAYDAADSLKSWDKGNDDIKLGGLAILTWQDDKMHTENVSPRKTGKGAEWGLGIGAVVGILSGGVSLIGGALVGAAAGAIGGHFSHKGIGLTDDDKTKLEDHLKDGGAALVAMASDDEVQAVKGFLNNLNVGEVQDYQVPDDTVQKLDDAKDVPAPDASDDDTSTDAS